VHKVRIIIPTNRADFLKEICQFYKNKKFNVSIVHSFKLKNKLKASKNIKFIYHNDTLTKRLIYVLNRTKEKYVTIMADDDFVFEDSINKSINFLEKNNEYFAAQGLHHRFQVKKNHIKFFPRAIKAMMNFSEDSKFINLRLLQSFTFKFIDKFYIVMKRKDLMNICKTCLPIEKYSRVLIEYYWIICCAISGKSKILNNIYCFRREHKKNDTKITTSIGLDKAICDKNFIKILIDCLNNFQKKSKIKKTFNKKILFLILIIFRLKIILKGKFKIIRILLDKLRNLREKKLEKNYKLIQKIEKEKIEFLKKIVLN